MTGLVENKIGIITGAGSGIGKATAHLAVREGARLMLADLNADACEATAAACRADGGTVEAMRADVGNATDVDALIAATRKRFGALDFACNIAGIEGRPAPLADQTDGDFDRVMTVNVRGMFNALRAEIRAMLGSGGGAIVNVASGAGLVAVPGMPLYSASKHAVVGMTQAAALDYGARGIRVNAVLPGIVNTPMFNERMAVDQDHVERMAKASPIGRFSQPEEQAEAILWLASDRASYCLGSCLVVDGGYLAQ